MRTTRGGGGSLPKSVHRPGIAMSALKNNPAAVIYPLQRTQPSQKKYCEFNSPR